MQVTCPKCEKEYDDTYRDTGCPHKTFEMHCGVVVKGRRGCAHTLEEQAAASKPDAEEPPNVDCPMNQMVESFTKEFALQGRVTIERKDSEDVDGPMMSYWFSDDRGRVGEVTANKNGIGLVGGFHFDAWNRNFSEWVLWAHLRKAERQVEHLKTGGLSLLTEEELEPSAKIVEDESGSDSGWAWIRNKIAVSCPEFVKEPRTDSLRGTKYEVMGWMHNVCHNAVAGYRTYLDIATEQQKRADEAEAMVRTLTADLALRKQVTDELIEKAYVEQSKVVEERDRLKEAIETHRAQKADDRCIEDDDKLYEALGDGIKCDRRVGDKDAMLRNCQRFIEKRCEAGGPWKSYAELESDNNELTKELKGVQELLDKLFGPHAWEDRSIGFYSLADWVKEALNNVEVDVLRRMASKIRKRNDFIRLLESQCQGLIHELYRHAEWATLAYEIRNRVLEGQGEIEIKLSADFSAVEHSLADCIARIKRVEQLERGEAATFPKLTPNRTGKTIEYKRGTYYLSHTIWEDGHEEVEIHRCAPEELFHSFDSSEKDLPRPEQVVHTCDKQQFGQVFARFAELIEPMPLIISEVEGLTIPMAPDLADRLLTCTVCEVRLGETPPELGPDALYVTCPKCGRLTKKLEDRPADPIAKFIREQTNDPDRSIPFKPEEVRRGPCEDLYADQSIPYPPVTKWSTSGLSTEEASRLLRRSIGAPETEPQSRGAKLLEEQGCNCVTLAQANTLGFPGSTDKFLREVEDPIRHAEDCAYRVKFTEPGKVQLTATCLLADRDCFQTNCVKCNPTGKLSPYGAYLLPTVFDHHWTRGRLGIEHLTDEAAAGGETADDVRAEIYQRVANRKTKDEGISMAEVYWPDIKTCFHSRLTKNCISCLLGHAGRMHVQVLKLEQELKSKTQGDFKDLKLYAIGTEDRKVVTIDDGHVTIAPDATPGELAEAILYLLSVVARSGPPQSVQAAMNAFMLAQLEKARGRAGHQEEAGEVCREDCTGCNDPVGSLIGDITALTATAQSRGQEISNLKAGLRGIRDSQESDLGVYAKFCQETAATLLGEPTGNDRMIESLSSPAAKAVNEALNKFRYIVVYKHDADAPEIHPFTTEAEAMLLYNELTIAWSSVYLCLILKGPKDETAEPPFPFAALSQLKAASLEYLAAEREYHDAHLKSEAGPGICMRAQKAEIRLATMLGIDMVGDGSHMEDETNAVRFTDLEVNAVNTTPDLVTIQEIEDEIHFIGNLFDAGSRRVCFDRLMCKLSFVQTVDSELSRELWSAMEEDAKAVSPRSIVSQVLKHALS